MNTLEIRADASDYRVARYAAAAIMLSVAEAAIPSPLPGVKPGLANIVVLLVLLRHGWHEAAWVALLRVFAANLLLGQLFAPGFFLSLAGSLFSLATLALTVSLPRRWFGPVSLSLFAAFAHMLGQMLLARVWLVPHEGLWALWPVFSAAATVFGLVNGLIVARLIAEPSVPANPESVPSS
ncbi:MAG: heptaprenyl diphosphate synthase [Candidatus Dactylopiibacterium carminicum]|uniref:Heptaprenyl diphosphate synthase n=2 Tax=Candidatus Dactylopiibacterium carminicum TaxID=857335 RepID=A0A272EW26_9RHOO|nr:heptaprenyl diphosphate synthase [Candidatus Dactylopiibacterium carminicum]PAS94309.1 MAG: heptaprenyl diphosphate synthase [Candidatus Dactylopiibacterium carminicum]PAS98503.1 MAG: heptaprenyl diphosphate synthase [Candidatus Dactylopiibacterium carminicum]PAS99505.1 MAG: heptaprenyl diphosphate synthase [Candidatus Dactylopiibacterium carminicum]